MFTVRGYRRKKIKKKMSNQFIGEDFLLHSSTAKRLYHDYAETMPIIDYHCHLPVAQIRENTHFQNLTDIWLRGDHYKWRAMRTFGVEERFITGDGSDRDKFRRWAAVVPHTLRNPLFHWTHMELKNPFGITELLGEANADKVYDHCNELLATDAFSAKGLLEHFQVRTVCTTDDPCDDLKDHDLIRESGFKIKVLPAFRPDKILNLTGGDSFRRYVERLSACSSVSITDLQSLLDALENRVAYFHSKGGGLADHGLNYVPLFDPHGEKAVDETLKKVLAGDDRAASDPRAVDAYAGYVLYRLCGMYHAKGWVQQFHLGALRNVNTKKLEVFGPDTGFDSIGDFPQAQGLAGLFDSLERSQQLTKTILYNLNPADNDVFATMIGNFMEGPTRGKMQYGASWWFLDQLDGMEKQINSLSNMGLLGCFVGMLTDSRSFLSYSRHDYFRRLLCDILGRDVEAGLLPADEKWLGGMVQDICYNNAHEYFNW